MTTTTNLDDILRKVGALLNQADHPNTSPTEADTFRAKAEALMFKYRIDELSLNRDQKASAASILAWRTITVCDYRSEFRHEYIRLVDAVLNHLEIRGRLTVEKGEHYNQDMYVEHIVGYESDLRFAELLITSVRLAFGTKLEPKYDPSLSEQINAYNMRSAGMEGGRIARAIYGVDTIPLRKKCRNAFSAEARLRGEDPAALRGLGNNMKLFRESFAAGFVRTFSSRLFQMRSARTGGSELVLASRKGDVDEAYYTRYPDERPMPASTAQIGDGYDSCENCKKAKSGGCAQHPWRRASRAQPKTRQANSTAWARGADAARSIDLGITGREVR